MLEALIRTKSSPCSDKRKGDVICIKLKELADWGAMERRVHMVVDWEDDELEFVMRKEGSTTAVTPYKTNEPCSIDNSTGEHLFYSKLTATRSKKYFDIDLGMQAEKDEKQISQEFEENKEFAKNQYLKEKPDPSIQSVSVADNKQYLEHLSNLQKELHKLGIKTEIIDGKLVRV